MLATPDSPEGEVHDAVKHVAIGRERPEQFILRRMMNIFVPVKDNAATSEKRKEARKNVITVVAAVILLLNFLVQNIQAGS